MAAAAGGTEGSVIVVGGQQRQPSPSALTPQLDAWLKRLQRSLSVEADHGFGNLQGHSSSFCVFAEQCCAKGEPTLPATELPPLQRFAKALNGYVSLNTDQRRRLVTQLRQHLHQLRQRLDPPAPPAPPRRGRAGSPPGPWRTRPREAAQPGQARSSALGSPPGADSSSNAMALTQY